MTKSLVGACLQAKGIEIMGSAVRVGLFCRVLPTYRLGVYERLANRPNIDLTVLYSKEPSWYSLKTVNPNGRFKSELIEMRAWRIGKQEFLYHPKAKRIITSGRFDVVVLPANPRLLSNFPALWAAKRHHVGVVWWGMVQMYRQSNLTYFFRKKLMDITRAVLVYTPQEAERLASSGLKRDRIFIAQNTIDVSEIIAESVRWSKERLNRFRVSEGLADKKVFLYCARLTRVKRPDLLVSALSTVIRNDPSVLLVVIGDGEEKARVRELAEDLRIGSHIRWLGPVYGHTDLASWYLSARALVIPEGIGLAVLQAFAYSLPCVTSENRQYQSPEWESITHMRNGLLYEHRNTEALAEAMGLLATDDELRACLGAKALETVTKEWTCEKMVDGFCRAIRYANEMSHH